MIRQALKDMGLAELIGYGKKSLIPPRQPAKDLGKGGAGNKTFLTRFAAPDASAGGRSAAPKRAGRAKSRKPKPSSRRRQG